MGFGVPWLLWFETTFKLLWWMIRSFAERPIIESPGHRHKLRGRFDDIVGSHGGCEKQNSMMLMTANGDGEGKSAREIVQLDTIEA